MEAYVDDHLLFVIELCLSLFIEFSIASLFSAGRYVFLDHVLNYTSAEMADMRQLAALSAAANAKATPFIPGTVPCRTSAAFENFDAEIFSSQ